MFFLIHSLIGILIILYFLSFAIIQAASIMILNDVQKNHDTPHVATALMNKINTPMIFGGFIVQLITILFRYYRPFLYHLPLVMWHLYQLKNRNPINGYHIYDSTIIIRKRDSVKCMREFVVKSGYTSMLMIIYFGSFFFSNP